MSETIQFFNEDVDFSLNELQKTISWITKTCALSGYKIENINYIFCSDEYLLNINKEHLNHNYYTDIITFDMSEEENKVEADIFISTDRVAENAKSNSVVFDLEMLRVLIHGLLHLIGFNDKTEEERIIMRKKEDACLSLFNN